MRVQSIPGHTFSGPGIEATDNFDCGFAVWQFFVTSALQSTVHTVATA